MFHHESLNTHINTIYIHAESNFAFALALKTEHALFLHGEGYGSNLRLICGNYSFGKPCI